MTDPRNDTTIVTLKIELPKEFADGLPDDYWTRLEMLVADALRLNEPRPPTFYPSVWREK